MRPKTITQTGVGTTAWIPLNRMNTPFNVSLGAVINGTITYTIQHTFDNILDPVIAQGVITPFDNANMTGQTTNSSGNYAFPVTAVRINVTAGTGSVALTIHQGATT